MENSITKSEKLSTSITLVNDKLQFKAEVAGNDPVLIDYIPPLGDNLGYTSLELLLISLSSCVGSTLLIFLRKMKKSIKAFDISAVGIRREEHPIGFKSIVLEINIHSQDISDDEMKKVLKLADDYCPVMAMLKGNVEIIQNYNIL
ncbi:MAG: OsmC family protein [Bacteroidota bacterium]|nr:OsmC family protein [Bacteroidota bacterium]